MASLSGHRYGMREANRRTDLDALLALIVTARLEQSAENGAQPLDLGDPHQWRFADDDMDGRAECIMVAADSQPQVLSKIGQVSDLSPQPSFAIVGFARYGQYRVKRAYDGTVQSTVFVHSPARGRGVGSALYARLIEQARMQGVRCRGLHIACLYVCCVLNPVSA